ncbi:MAG: carbohydrate ABC transporter permease [Propionibacteriaceae bacterium]|nr:carbohydrate ABC transporter permease [Propionibacteriaceae bacterium]
MKPKKLAQKTGVMIALIAGACFAGLPVVWMVSSSFKPNTQIFAYPPHLFESDMSWTAYAAIFTDPEKVRFFLNSYLVALSVTAGTLFVGIMGAYAFSRWEFRGKRVLNTLIISVQAIPPITLLIPYFGLIVALGLYNTYWALILTYMVFTLPYAILMLTGYFNTIPRALDEAVMIDGANRFKALWQVIVPVSIPGLVSVAIYTFMQAWNEFLFALTLTKTNNMRTVPIGIQLLMGQHNYEWNQMMAMSILGCLPVLILFLFFQRYFIGGMTAGAVKN